jgi:predicted RNase H-like HicB family nuclease
MLVLIQNPTGPDEQIALLQVAIIEQAFPLWGLDQDDPGFVVYPACSKNPDPAAGAGYIAELYQGGGEYREVFWDDSLKGIIFFGYGPKTTRQNGKEWIDVHLVCFADTKVLYPALEHRAAYEVRRDLAQMLRAPLYGFQLDSLETGLPNVLKEYPGSRRDKRLIAADMGNVHAFRLNLSLEYYPDQQSNF